MIKDILLPKKIVELLSVAAARMNKTADYVKRIMTFGLADESIAPDKRVCVALEKGRVVVAGGARSFSRVRVKGIKTYDFDHDIIPQAENIAGILQKAMSDLGMSKSAVTLSIPKDWTIMKTAELPAVVKENLANVVSYELDRLTPLNSDNAFYDFRILREEEDNLKIMVEAVKRDLLQSYLEVIKGIGLRVVKVTDHFSAIGTYCLFCRKPDAVYVEITADEYRCALIQKGLPERILAAKLHNEDPMLRNQTIAGDINALFESSVMNSFAPVIVSADNDDYEELNRCMPNDREIINVADLKCELFPLERNESPVVIGGLLESLWPKAAGIDLLSKGRHQRERTPMIVTGMLCAVLLLTMIIYVMTPLRLAEKRIHELDRQIALRRDEVNKVDVVKKEIDAIQNEMTIIEQFKSKRPVVLNILRELTLLLPKGSWLSRVRITETTVDIEGYAASATELLPKLEASNYLKKVEFASPTFRDIRANAERFMIKMEIDDSGGKVNAEKE